MARQAGASLVVHAPSTMDYVRLSLSTSLHSASVTGMTDNRGSRVSTNDANALDALISDNVTGRVRANRGHVHTTACPSCPSDRDRRRRWLSRCPPPILVPRVVIEDTVAFLYTPQMLLRQRVLDSSPDRPAVFCEFFETVARRFLFKQPFHGSLSPRVVGRNVSCAL